MALRESWGNVAAETESRQRRKAMPDNKTSFFDSDWTKIGAIAAIGGIIAALFIAGIGLHLNFVVS